MKRKILLLIFIPSVLVLILIFYIYIEKNNFNLNEIKNLNSTVISIDKFYNSHYLVATTVTTARWDNGNFTLNLGYGGLHLLSIFKNRDGSYGTKSLWDYVLGESELFSYPLIIDLDNDGINEVMVVEESLQSSTNNNQTKLLVFRHIFTQPSYEKKLIFQFDDSLFIYSLYPLDFDNDGDLDLVLVGFDKKMKVGKLILLSRDVGKFDKKWQCSFGDRILSVFGYDVNKDGYKDLIFSGISNNSDGFISIALNNFGYENLFHIINTKTFPSNPILTMKTLKTESRNVIALASPNEILILELSRDKIPKLNVLFSKNYSPNKLTTLNINDINRDGIEDLLIGYVLFGDKKPIACVELASFSNERFELLGKNV